MKKLGMFMIIGALAWSLQACNNNRNNDDTMDSRDSVYNNDNNNNPNINSPMTDTSTMTPMDSTGTGNMNNGTDTTGTNRPNTIP